MNDQDKIIQNFQGGVLFFNIKSQVKKLSPNVNTLSVLNETVVNSIQAGAKKIDIFFSFESSEDLFIKEPCLSEIKITDNGEGFHEKNIESFCTYGSTLKEELGCKGIGRLFFLKIFDTIEIRSFLKESNKEVYIHFNEQFRKEQVEENHTSNAITQNSTTIVFKDIRNPYKKPYGLKECKESLYDHILPLLYLRRNNHNIQINLMDEQQRDKGFDIKTNNLPAFQTLEFDIREQVTNTKNKVKFTLHYSFLESKDPKGALEGFYCAHQRTVCNFKEMKLKISPIKNKKIIFLLTSDFLDLTINDERNEFNIYEVKTDMVHTLSWEQINNALKENIKSILYQEFPELDKKNKDIMRKIKEENLHLADYLSDLDTLGGLIDSETVIKKGEEIYSRDKTEFRKQLKEEKIDSEEIIRKASSLAGKELIEYVLTRDKIISQLEKFHDDSEKKEHLIHDLILKKGTDSDRIAPISLKENNIWLIDDKFMSYSYIASDKSIKESLFKIGYEAGNRRRPDLSVFFLNNNNNHNAVIIELKPFTDDSDKKFDGLSQLRKYAEALKNTEGLDCIWYYLITKIDENFRKELVKDDYQPLFSNEDNIYFKYYNNMSLYLYVMSSDALIADAKARNKVFIDITKELSGLGCSEEEKKNAA